MSDRYLRVGDGAAPDLAEIRTFDRALQEDVEALLGFLRRTGYPAVAAPQLGIRRRIVAVDLSRSGRGAIVLVNPVVESVSLERCTDLEGCIGLPGLRIRVSRPCRAVIRGFSREGQPVGIEAMGLLARTLLHKLDHLKGRLILDRLPEPRRRAALEGLRRAPACALPRRRRFSGAAP